MKLREYERRTRGSVISKGAKRRWAVRRTEEIDEWKAKTGQTEILAFVNDERR